MTARKRRPSRAAFGSTRQLASGRWQARYTDATMTSRTAPSTFTTKREAEDWLATIRADMVRGTWRAPDLGTTTLADYARERLATRLDLAPKTRETYAGVLDRWIDTPLNLPSSTGRTPARLRVINLGAFELGALNLTAVRDWHAAALHTASTRAAERIQRQQQQASRAVTIHAARAWARTHDLAVPDTGRLPARVLRAWEAAGAPPTPTTLRALPAGKAAPPPSGRASIAQAYRLLHMLLAQAVSEGRIVANPCQLSGASTARTTTDRIPATLEQLDTITAAMPERYAAAVPLAAWSALRAGEVFGLTRRHVDLEAGTVRVEHQAVTCLADTPPYLGPTKTQASRRTVHLPASVIATLREHMERFTPAGPDALIFTTPTGGIVSRTVRQHAFARARTAAGRPDLRFHDLRHTGATLAAQHGATIAELQRRLGHTTPRAAMVYQHASADRDRDLARRLDTVASPARPRPTSPAAVVSIASREASA